MFARVRQPDGSTTEAVELMPRLNPATVPTITHICCLGASGPGTDELPLAAISPASARTVANPTIPNPIPHRASNSRREKLNGLVVIDI